MSAFGELIKGASEVLCPISVDDDLVHLVCVEAVVGALAGVIAVEGAVGNCGGVGGRVRAESLNAAGPMDFEASEPGGLNFPAARGGWWARESDGNGETEKLAGRGCDGRGGVEKTGHGGSSSRRVEEVAKGDIGAR